MIGRAAACIALLIGLGLTACSSRAETGSRSAESREIVGSRQAVKIGVSRAGIYRLDVDTLYSLGLMPSGALFDQAALYCDGHLVPIWRDASSETLMFYGLPPTSRFAPLAVYLLRWDSGQNGVMPIEELPPAVDGSPAVFGTALQLEENVIYLPRAAQAMTDPWLWVRMAPGTPADLAFDLPAAAEGQGTLIVSLWGASASQEIEPDHRVMISLNSVELGAVTWDGETVASGSWIFPSDILETGENRLALTITGDTGNPADLSYLDWFRIALPIPTAGESDWQVVTAGPGRLTADPDDLVLDLSDASLPVRLEVPPQGGLLDSERVIAFVKPGGGQEPAFVAATTDSTWSDSNHQADYLILAPTDLSGALAPLVSAREAQGLAPLVVPVEELGDEFGGGAVTPDALHAFLAHVYEAWGSPAPQYLLLVGDATYDFRDYLGQRPPYVVPSMVVPVAFGGETLSDGRMADLDDDGLPELAVGRWPVSDESQVVALVQRTLEYEITGRPARPALFVADTSEATFPAMSDRLIAAGGLDSNATRLYGVTSRETIQAWNRGAWLINYVGHGSLDLWGKAGLLSLASLADLQPAEHPPIVTQFTCLTGFFGHPQLISLAEAMLQADNGPVATIAATSLTLAADQEAFAATLIAQLADPATLRIGDAFLRAQQSPGLDSKGGREVIATFHLFGDPALIIARPD
jgi:hypothetical protein